jgi:hypothetical protein
MESSDIQPENKQKEKITPLLPYMWKKGQSGNPAGRPKGKTMKEYAKELLECQTEEERQEFLHGLPKEIIWKMAEGNPKQDAEVEHKGNVVITGIEMIVPNVKDNSSTNI